MMSSKSQGAVSTEMVIVLVLIAVFSILGFMFIGQQLRNHQQNITNKVGGQSATNKRSLHRILPPVDTDLGPLGDRNEMSGAAGLGETVGGPASQVLPIP